MGEPPRMYNCPPWSPVKVTPGKTCKYCAKSGVPPTDGILVICFEVMVTVLVFTSVLDSCLAAEI